jgi:bifunctional non-homologous end joining protein LigD
MTSRPSLSITRLIAELDAAEAEHTDATIHITRGSTLHVSHLDKVFFPKDDITKGDLMRYYAWISPYILPLLKDRPLALKRFPNGIGEESFFQQKAPTRPPKAVRVETLTSESGEPQERVVGGTLATLLYCVQLGTIECNPWNARVRTLEYVDYSVIDLDPGPQVPFDQVVETALWIKDALDAFGFHGAVKTSGVSGIHVYIPLPAKTSERSAELVGSLVAQKVASDHPQGATVQRSIKTRGATKVYVDAGQNSRGKTVAAAYSVRATPGGLVSTPLAWEELTPHCDPSLYTIHTVPTRLATIGDLWTPVMKRPISLKGVTKP